jgi:hypothetical protein
LRVSPELAVMFRPARSYARLAAAAERPSRVLAVRRPALVALVLGATLAIAATHRVEAAMVASVTLYWSVVPIVQWIAAYLIIRTSAARMVSIPRAIDLCFVAAGPWSCWLIAFGAWAAFEPPIARPMAPILWAALIPIAWTPILIFAFCRAVLRNSQAAALWRTLAHQALVWVPAALTIAQAVQLWPRLLAWSTR